MPQPAEQDEVDYAVVINLNHEDFITIEDRIGELFRAQKDHLCDCIVGGSGEDILGTFEFASSESAIAFAQNLLEAACTHDITELNLEMATTPKYLLQL